MTTLRGLARGLADIPMSTAWYLSDLAEEKGRPQLFMHKSPQRLKALCEHAMRDLITVVAASSEESGNARFNQVLSWIIAIVSGVGRRNAG